MLILAIAFTAGLSAYPVPKIGQCPSGYISGANYCTPALPTTRPAVPKHGTCPNGWVQSGGYCLGPNNG